MKLTTMIVTALLTLSTSAMAADPITHLSVASIKQTLTQEQIQDELRDWYKNELTQVEQRAQKMSDRAPIEARRQYVKQSIEHEYQTMKTEFGL